MSRLMATSAVAMTLAGLAAAPAAGAATRLVGPGHPYATPCQAIAASAAGDTVQIDAAGNGSYDGDVCTSGVANLTIEGVGGRAHIDAAGRISGGKGIWVLSGPDTVVRNVELSGATAPDRNGAGIRLEGDGDLTLSNVSIHDNEDGILVTGSAETDVVVEGSAFANNGHSDGQAHNIYVARARSFTMRGSSSRGAKVGHLVKSRATVNDLLYNRLTGEGSTASYEIDLPNGGRSRVIGNVIEQGPSTGNSNMLAYGAEGASNPDSRLTVANNTFVNDRPQGGTAVFVGGSVTIPVSVVNNIGVGQTAFVTQATAQLASNCLVPDARFVNRAAFDYHLTPESPCRDAGTAAIGDDLPTQQYVYDQGLEPRAVVGAAPDAGAFEWGSSATPPGRVPSPGPGTPSPTTPPTAGGSAAASTVRVLRRRIRRDGTVSLTLRVSGPGPVRATATTRAAGGSHRKIVYGRGSASSKRAGRLTLTLRPTRAGRTTLRRRGRVALAVTVRFRPSGATATATRTAKVTLRRTRRGVVAG